MQAFKDWAQLIGLGVLFLVASAAAMAQTTYRWDDADGQTHYSDQPPPAGALNVKVIKDSGINSGDGDEDDDEDYDSDDEPAYVEREAEFQERQAKKAEDEAEAEKERMAEEERKRNCDLARGNYNTISAGGRITRVNSDGEREFLSDEEIEEEKVRAREVMEQWCED